MCYACTVISLSLTALVIIANVATAAATVSKHQSQGTAHDVMQHKLCVSDASAATSNDAYLTPVSNVVISGECDVTVASEPCRVHAAMHDVTVYQQY
eukprot:20980-Heterococcus_DN1.PRE.3